MPRNTYTKYLPGHNIIIIHSLQTKQFALCSLQTLWKKREFNGTSTHLLDGYISANQIFFSTFLSKITKYNRVPLGFDPSVARLLGHDPTPRPTCPVEYKRNLELKIYNITLPMATHPKVLAFTLDLKLTYCTHTHNISVLAHKPIQIIKSLTATGWGKQKETSATSINKLQVMH